MARSNTIKGTYKSDALQGTELQSDIIYGYGGNDWLFGYSGNDILNGGSGDDYLIAGSGDDILEGGSGADYLSGGRGTDTASYAGSTSGVTVNLVNGTGSRGDAQGDTYSSIENITGSAHQDILIGDYRINVIHGGDEDDLIDGGSGNDKLYGDDGDDEIYGGAGNDTIEGGSGYDELYGGDNDDTFISGSGFDHHDGGSGEDTVDYSNSYEGVDIDLSAGLGPNGDGGIGMNGDATYDTFVSIENIIGSDFGDLIVGNDSDNTFHGGGGGDTLAGGNGNDKLYGEGGDDYFIAIGTGEDEYYGGDGNDTISYLGSDEGVAVDLDAHQAGTVSGVYDEIYDIENVFGTDHIDILRGNAQDNLFYAGGGEDLVVDTLGNDTYRLSADGEADTFYLFDIQSEETDVIEDFEVGIDKLNFANAVEFTGYNDLFNGGNRFAEEVDGDTIIHYYDHQIVLEDVALNDLSPGDFIFA